MYYVITIPIITQLTQELDSLCGQRPNYALRLIKDRPRKIFCPLANNMWANQVVLWCVQISDFFSPVSASAVSKSIFEIKATDYKNFFLCLCCLNQSKMSYPLVIWMQAPYQKSVVVVLLLITAQADQEVLSLDHQYRGLGLQVQRDRSSVRNIFEGSLTE